MIKRIAIVSALVALLGPPLSSARAAPAPGYALGQILVKFKPGTSASVKAAVHRKNRTRVLQEIPKIGVQKVTARPGTEMAQVRRYAANPNVEFAETDTLMDPAEVIPNDPYYMYQMGLNIIGGPAAWSITSGSPSVIIAILDTGVDTSHPDLAPNIVSGWNAFDNNADTTDILGHGTLVAGTAAARGNNGVGVCSVAWNCKIMPIRVSDLDGFGYASAMAAGLVWAVDHGARVANISYAMSNVASLSVAEQYFQERGGVISVSAGNSSYFNPSPDDPYVLTTTATTVSDQIYSWSNTGNNVDLAAPGGTFSTCRGGGYSDVGGTSISAPVVAGVAALVMSVDPNLTGPQVQDVLRQSSDDLGAAGWDPQFGWGRVNAARAVELALPAGGSSDTTLPIVAVYEPGDGSVVAGAVTVTVSASDNVSVACVDLYLDETPVGRDTLAPYDFEWDTLSSPNGGHTLRVTASDGAGNISQTELSILVSNPTPDTTPPSVQIISPVGGSTVGSTVTVTVSAGDDVDVRKVQLYVDARLTATSTTKPFTTKWNARKAAKGPHSIVCRAYDAAGNTADSSITVYK